MPLLSITSVPSNNCRGHSVYLEFPKVKATENTCDIVEAKGGTDQETDTQGHYT